ncbi:TetR/AcrR family transcriptional regulator [Sinimarinibacterium sp. CAU 1509]|uniref:TetR-like C-terminal domain-containing protein n=1 Tax=Sinimarinibacterium sp. CAU 1509 TaxID=2562283 RepID=UPI0010AC6B38|nr:TetR-like C-terminal domain-containing protein [Sinimarinibacterium sp. CAU 1509]TJY63305.1 TetR/AcrR family transcriptional regulator [Sinimarinibacterium sp. CAU 1509]
MPRPRHSKQTEQSAAARLTQLALDLYLEEGLAAVTFRKLADRGGLSHTYPYRFFDNKAALLLALRTLSSQRFVAFVTAADKPRRRPTDRLRLLARAMVRFALEHPAEYELIFSLEESSPDQFPELLAVRQSLLEHVAGIAAQAVQRGDADGDADLLAQLLWAGVHGIVSLHMGRQLVHGRSVETLLEPMLDRLIGAS